MKSMSSEWVTENLENALGIWNEKLQEMWSLMTSSPSSFRGGTIWAAVLAVFRSLQSVGYALLVLFFLADVLRSASSIQELKRPENAVRMFLRFILSKTALTYGLELLEALIELFQGAAEKIFTLSGTEVPVVSSLPADLISAAKELGFFESIPVWVLSLLCTLMIWAISFVLILTVYGRFFRLFLLTAVAPLPLASLAGEQTKNIALSFLRNYAAVCLEDVITALSLVIFCAFSSSPPQFSSGGSVSAIWSYMGELIFMMLVLSGAVKSADRIAKEVMGA